MGLVSWLLYDFDSQNFNSTEIEVLNTAIICTH